MRAIYEMPSIALVGAPGSGRSQLLRALAPQSRHRASLSARLAADHGRVALADPLLAEMARLLGSAKSTPIQVDFVDCQAGLGAAHGQAEWFGNLAAFDALALVLGLYAEPDPVAGLDSALDLLRDELNLWDLGLAERRLERIGAELVRAPRAERVRLERERDLFGRIVDHLDGAGSLADFDLQAADMDLLRGFGFLGGKPFLVIANTADSAVGEWGRLQAKCRWPLVGVCAELESEAVELDPALGSELLSEFGITGGAGIATGPDRGRPRPGDPGLLHRQPARGARLGVRSAGQRPRAGRGRPQRRGARVHPGRDHRGGRIDRTGIAGPGAGARAPAARGARLPPGRRRPGEHPLFGLTTGRGGPLRRFRPAI